MALGEGWLHIDGFYANKYGKFYRSCGNCSQQFQRHVNITNFVGIQGVVSKLSPVCPPVPLSSADIPA